MATTVTNSTFKVTIVEELLLNGEQQGTTTRLLIPATGTSIDEYSRRIVTCAEAGTSLAVFGTTGAGTYPVADVKYIRITNLDGTNYITIELATADADCFIKVPAGHTFLLGGAQGMADDDATLRDLTRINVTANGDPVDVELIVVSV